MSHVSSINVGQMRAPSSLDQPLLARNIMTPLRSTSHHQPMDQSVETSEARRHGRSKVSVQRLKLPLTSRNPKNHRLNHSWDDWKIVGLRFESYHMLRLSVYLISAFHPLWNRSGAAKATQQMRSETQQTHVTSLTRSRNPFFWCALAPGLSRKFAAGANFRTYPWNSCSYSAVLSNPFANHLKSLKNWLMMAILGQPAIFAANKISNSQPAAPKKSIRP